MEHLIDIAKEITAALIASGIIGLIFEEAQEAHFKISP